MYLNGWVGGLVCAKENAWYLTTTGDLQDWQGAQARLSLRALEVVEVASVSSYSDSE